MSGAGPGPLITDIHRFALDDGPGIRTTVFTKGCTLSCAWCHNPECMSPDPEIAFHRDLCIGCGDCAAACPHGAIRMDSDERIVREICAACGDCAAACPATALRTVGRRYPVPELTETLLKDRLFYEASGGGVTFSGGEPTLFMDYVARTAKGLKEMGVPTAIQTSGDFDGDEFLDTLLPYVDLVFFDIKILDRAKHREWTGKGNGRILDNFVRLASLSGVRVVPRIPLVPGATATEENIAGIGGFLRKAGRTDCEFLGYNSGGMAKRALLGRPVPEALREVRPDRGEEERLRGVFARAVAGPGSAGAAAAGRGKRSLQTKYI